MFTHSLDDLRAIRVSGADRASFLQGQLTQDLRAIAPDRSALFGWTTAPGRLLAVGQLFEWREACWLTVPAATAATLVRLLSRYVLRAKVSIELASETLTGLSGGAVAVELGLGPGRLPAVPLAVVAAGDCLLARVAGDPGRALVLAEATAAAALLAGRATGDTAPCGWGLADIRAGLPCIVPATSETFIPQMVNLDLIGGVSFDKGCYTGQEIVTRTRHIGRVKRRMLRFRADAAAVPAAGDPIFGHEREAGRVISAAPAPEGVELLAVTQLEEAGGPLFIDAARSLSLRRLALPYAVPEAGGD